MALLPNASVKTKVDFTRSRFEWKRQFEVAATANIVEEGSLLQRIPDAAGLKEVVDLSTNAGSLRPAGISLQSRISATTFAWVEEVVVPSGAPYTVQLSKTNIIDSGGGIAEAAAWDYNASAYLNVVAGAPLGTQFEVVPLTGLTTFNVAEAGHSVRMIYRYNLTAIERDELLRQSHVNRGAEDQFGLMTVAQGHCVVYTTMYDAQEKYLVGDQLTLDNNGLFSKSGATNFGVVISVPTASDPYLGVEYDAA